MNSLLQRAGAGSVLAVLCATPCHAAPALQGRWEGEVQVPGAPLTLIVDLAQGEASSWTGSVVMPGLGIKGAAIGDISVTDSGITFTMSGIMKAGGAAPPRISAHLTGAGALTGDFEQAGNRAHFTLNRIGPAQVEVAPNSTLVSGEAGGAAKGQPPCCAESAAAPTFRGDAAHSGEYASQAPRQFHRVKWKFATGDRVVSSAVWHDKVLYFGSDDGNVYAVEAETGHQLWKRTTGGPVPATPAVADGRIYVGSYDGKFYALDERTGTPVWTFVTSGERRFEGKGLHGLQPKNQTFADPFDVFLSSPVVAQGVVYFGSGDGHVYAVDAATGELRWKFQTGDVVHASPAYAGGVLYFGSWDSYFYAVDAATGQQKWRFKSGEDPLIHNQVGFQSSPVVANGVVYTGCRDAHLYAIDAASGKEKWRFPTDGSWVVSSPAVSGGRVFFATSDSSLYLVLDAETGKPVLQQQSKAYVFSSPSIAGDVVLLGVLNGTLEARDRTSGGLLWEYQTDASRRNIGWALTSERKFNAPLIFHSAWNQAPLVGVERQFSVGSIFSSPLVVDGVVYFGSADGNLYAID
jgi:outer membrane protein assembly factor BamB